jgi:alanine racemase
MERTRQFSNWLEVDLGAIENNVRQVRQITGVAVMAVVKADGYGHGAEEVARAALHAGASWCGVARIEEALELRSAGVEAPILVLGHTPAERVEEGIAARVSLTVWTSDHIQQAVRAARRLGMPARLHLKVDTGMSRLGAQPEEAQELAWRMTQGSGVVFEGLFTHLARADDADPATTDSQGQLFHQLLDSLAADGLRPPLVHAANSAASLTRRDLYFDLVRLGIAMYGLHPSAACPLPPTFRPALAWKSTLSQVKVVPPGRGISYGHEYTTTSHERIGTAPVGYADGFRRGSPNQVLVAGRIVPVVGRVCMDQIMVQLDAVPEAREGDEVALIGGQGGERISAEQVAQRWGTVNYEVVCGIGRRVPRLY